MLKQTPGDVLAAGVYFRDGLASQTDHFRALLLVFVCAQRYCVPDGYTKLRFVLLLLCLPAVLAYPRHPGEEGKEEDRTEGTDDGGTDEEEEEEGDDLEDRIHPSRPHCRRTAEAGRAPEHGQLVCICVRVYVRFVLVFQHGCCSYMCVPTCGTCLFYVATYISVVRTFCVSCSGRLSRARVALHLRDRLASTPAPLLVLHTRYRQEDQSA